MNTMPNTYCPKCNKKIAKVQRSDLEPALKKHIKAKHGKKKK